MTERERKVKSLREEERELMRVTSKESGRKRIKVCER